MTNNTIGANENQADYDYLKNVTFHFFDVTDSETTVYTSDLKQRLHIKAKIENNVLVVTTEGIDRAYQILLRNRRVLGVSDGCELKETEQGVLVIVKGSNIKVRIELDGGVK